MPNPSQLLLLADHIKLSLLERQRAISLSLEPNSQDGEISRSLDSFKEGIEAIEAECEQLEVQNGRGDEDAADLRDQLTHLHAQYDDLSAQFHEITNAVATATATSSSSTPDLKQPVPQHPSSKSVRFMDAAAAAEAADADEDEHRRNLFRPYRDSPSPPPGSTNAGMDGLSNEQIYDHHAQVLRDQDEQLDRLGESIGRQHQLSIQIGDELEGHVALLDDLDGHVDRHQGRLDKARKRLDRFRRSAGENWSMMTIIGLIITLVILIVLLK
ncbi:syntaxin family protein [Aspergillus saccharolyticus JOP 1030-1]|uniref:Snare-domain-containing protein n=1 Tax=Aspergillus saccharolyticus JOP 1030-1 TaxID=1450539 RepID=A0A318ZV21_9EURO|nr:snare-domain-containing protein [Aspergillus saccharolyticus JOP 1030-1]PYH43968.1 snare-domain-containing protein [Aspergillus saccharolyticus JOP 1030-1]